MKIASVSDYREAARLRLPRFLFEYIDGGSYSEQTLRENVDDLKSLSLRQRVMHDVSKVDLSTTMLGQAVTMPVALAPIGLAGLYARRGDACVLTRPSFDALASVLAIALDVALEHHLSIGVRPRPQRTYLVDPGSW